MPTTSLFRPLQLGPIDLPNRIVMALSPPVRIRLRESRHSCHWPLSMLVNYLAATSAATPPVVVLENRS